MISSKQGFESMEKESKTWMVQCSNCKYEKSIWEMGGIRAGASGKPKLYTKCSNCNQRNWHTIYKKDP
jgi:hypothetical protein